MPSGSDRTAGARRRDLLDDLPAMYFAVDVHGTILTVNRFGAEHLGYDVEELIGEDVLELVVEEDRARVREGLSTCAFKPGEVCRWEFRKHRKDGSELWVRETVRPVEGPVGDTMILMVCDDITENRLVEENLRESEERYRLLVDLIPQHIWITEPDGKHTYFSRQWYDYTGAGPEETHGEGWLRLLHPEDLQATVARWQRSLRTGEPYEVEYRFRNRVGEYRWFLGQAVPQRDDAGRIVRWIGTLTDIEERKRIASERERLLVVEREARQQVTTILESISDAFIAVDREWRFVYLNRRGEELIRASRPGAGDLLGQSLPEALPEVWNSEFGKAHRRAMEGRTTVHYEGYLAPWHRWIAVHDYPSADGLAIYFQDVTDRKRAEQERERLLVESERRREELERITDSRTRLMRGFSHDLKNPLGAADGHAQLLEDGILGELGGKQLDSVARIRRSIGAALHLINDLLELARAETGQIELHRQPSDLCAVVHDAIEDFRAQAAAEGLELTGRTSDRCVLHTDPARVRQILSNLLSNALKYTPAGSVSVTVDADASAYALADGSWAAVHVEDTGPGIPEDKRELAFMEFTRLDPGAPQGAGVGLAISRRIARILGGDLTLDSEVGRGSRFTLWIPRE